MLTPAIKQSEVIPRTETQISCPACDKKIKYSVPLYHPNRFAKAPKVDTIKWCESCGSHLIISSYLKINEMGKIDIDEEKTIVKVSLSRKLESAGPRGLTVRCRSKRQINKPQT
jgi:hypothetical protein